MSIWEYCVISWRAEDSACSVHVCSAQKHQERIERPGTITKDVLRPYRESSMDVICRVLGQMGRDGWEMVSAQAVYLESQEEPKTREFWMKRPTAESAQL